MNINSEEAMGIRLSDIKDAMKHQRELGFAFVFKAGSGACIKDLELDIDNSRIQ